MPSVNEKRAQALKNVSAHIRQYSRVFVQDGGASLSPQDAQRRKQQIEDEAVSLDQLAEKTLKDGGSYAEYEAILWKLRLLGWYPAADLSSAVAQLFSINPQ